ncbi:MAG: tripartite tricarboxylate transporter substrate binding protein, partial [Variibacter sp.]|nr:tripartite tricarboxylate transporter substrate binding protein [Variibacter sp.]
MHHPTRRTVLAGTAGLVGAAAVLRHARAASWRPSQTVRLIVPAAP